MTPQEELEYLRLKKRKAQAMQAQPPAPSVATGKPDFQNGGMDLVSEGGAQAMPSPKVPLGFRMATPFASAGMKIGADMRTKEGRQEWLGRARAAPGMLAHGATSGLSDEITGGFAEGRFPTHPVSLYASGLQGLYNEVTGNTSPAYDLLADKKNEEIAATREEYPVTSLVAEGAGASMIPMGSLGQGKTVLGTALRTGGAGTLAGGGYAFADADGDLSQRTTSGLIGAGVGAAGGVTLGALSRALAGDPDSIARVLDTEVIGPISSDAAKVIERVIRSANANITGRDVGAALQRLEQRVQGGVQGPAVPTRLKDFLIEEFPDAAEHITSFLQGVGRRGATAGSDVIENAVTEDIARLRTFYEDTANARLGGTSRVDMADSAEEAKKILSQRYDEVLGAADSTRPEAQQLRELIMSDPAIQGVGSPLKRKAMNRGLSVEEYVNQFPDEAGHWMRSRASKAARSAQGTEKVDLQDTVALYDDLLESNPSYAEVKRGWGTESGFEEALRFGNKFFSNAKDDLDFREMKRVYDRMSPYEQEAAKASIRQKFITEGLEGNKAGQNVRTTQAGRESALRGLRSMLGDEGDAFASDIEQMMTRIDGNTAISRRGKSPTAYLQKADEYAGKMASGSVGNAFANLLSGGVKDAGLSMGASMVSGNPVVLPFNAAKGAMNIAGNALNARADQRLRQATQTLMRDVTPTPRAAAPPPAAPTPSAPSAPVAGSLAPPQQSPQPANAFSPQPTKSSGIGNVQGMAGGAVAGGVAPLPDQGSFEDNAKLRAGAILGGALAGSRTGRNALREVAGMGPKTAKQALRAELPGSPEYQRAVSKGLDMSPDGRAMRAREQGFDTETVLYHGTDQSFDAFNPSSRGIMGKGVYLTPNSKTAEKYIRGSDGANIMPVYVRGKIAKQGETVGPEHVGRWVEDQVVIFDPTNIRSVNAAFDPDMAASPMLTAGPSGKLPKLKPDVPKGTPPKGGNPRLGGGNLIRQQYESTNPPRLPEGPMTDAQLAFRKKQDTVLPLVIKGASDEQILKQTGIPVFTYRDKTIILPDHMKAAKPETIRRAFYDAMQKPMEQRPEWVQRILRTTADPEEVGLAKARAWDKKNPLALGTERTPMVKEGKNALSGQ